MSEGPTITPIPCEVRYVAGVWAIFVDGQRVVTRRSYAEAHRIADHLRTGTTAYTAAGAVADSVREHRGKP